MVTMQSWKYQQLATTKMMLWNSGCTRGEFEEQCGISGFRPPLPACSHPFLSKTLIIYDSSGQRRARALLELRI